jgi:hypothetical protein
MNQQVKRVALQVIAVAFLLLLAAMFYAGTLPPSFLDGLS